jgi:hypothetical protein
MNTLAGEQHSGSAYTQTRTDVGSSLTVVQLLCFFLLSQPSKCPVSHTTLANKISPTKFPFHNSKTNLTSDITTAIDMLRFTNRSLFGLGTNYVGAQSRIEMANGAFNFDMDAVGRRAADLCLMDIQKNFNGQEWVQNGPLVILRVLQMLCGTNNVSVRPLDKCFNPLPIKSVYSYRTHLCFVP